MPGCPFNICVGRHLGERRKASADPLGVDRINEASANTRLISLMGGKLIGPRNVWFVLS